PGGAPPGRARAGHAGPLAGRRRTAGLRASHAGGHVHRLRLPAGRRAPVWGRPAAPAPSPPREHLPAVRPPPPTRGAPRAPTSPPRSARARGPPPPPRPPRRVSAGGPVSRYERPAKGRYRQFTQCGVELVGAPGPLADAEVVALAMDALDRLGLREYRVT